MLDATIELHNGSALPMFDVHVVIGTVVQSVAHRIGVVAPTTKPRQDKESTNILRHVAETKRFESYVGPVGVECMFGDHGEHVRLRSVYRPEV